MQEARILNISSKSGRRWGPWKWAIKRYSNIHIPGDEPNVFVFSTARSGSTWLMEIIASQPRIKFINEPLLMSQFDCAGAPLPASWEFLLPHPEREPRLEAYFHQLLANKLGVGCPAPFSRFHRIISRRVVVKDLRCHDLMNWFEKRFNFKIIYLVRHPIPTAVSRKEYARLALFLSNDLYCQRYLSPDLRTYAWSIVEHGSDLQKKVLDWCLQNLPPMKFLDRSKWFCVHYEDIVMEPKVVIERLADFLGDVDKDKMLRQVSSASSSVFLSDPQTQHFLNQQGANTDRLYLVNKWQSRISPEQEQQVFEVLRRFEIDTYESGNPLPAHRL